MAVVLGVVTSAVLGAPFQVTHDTTSETGRATLLVAIQWRERGFSPDGIFLDSVSYRGNAMARVWAEDHLELFKLDRPENDVGDIIAVFGGDPTGVGVMVLGAVTFAETAEDAITGLAHASGSSSSPSVNVSGTVDDALLFSCLGILSGALTNVSIAPTPPQAEVYDRSFSASPDRIQGEGTVKDSLVGPTTMSNSLGGSRAWSIIAVEVLPFVEPPIPPEPPSVVAKQLLSEYVKHELRFGPGIDLDRPTGRGV